MEISSEAKRQYEPRRMKEQDVEKIAAVREQAARLYDAIKAVGKRSSEAQTLLDQSHSYLEISVMLAVKASSRN